MSEPSRGHRWPWLVLYSLLLVAGPTLAVSSAVYTHADQLKKERLAVVGVPVTATVADRDWNSSASRDKTTVSYQVDGATYTRTISGLASGPTLALRVDPEDPTAFLSELGSTDGSRSPINGWANLGWGVALLALGAGGFVAHRRAGRRRGTHTTR